MAGSATVSRWARGFVAASACWFVIWQTATLFELDRRVLVPLALQGFVLHMVFGKAYALIPSYFDRDLAFARAPTLHLPLALVGTAGIAVGALPGGPEWAAGAGAGFWAAGVLVFLVTISWTIRDNLTGAETATGDHNADRRPVDRVANVFVPVALLYLAAGSYAALAVHLPLPLLFDAYGPRVSHLLAAGTATLLVFAIGFRLLPRFLVASPPRPLVYVVLPAGALGPILLAAGLPSGPLLHAGVLFQGIAVVGFALAYMWLLWDTPRNRIGFYAVGLGALAGIGVIALGATLAFDLTDWGWLAIVAAHYRLALLGFLGLTIVGVTFQFYPPTVGRFPLAGGRLAAAIIAAIAVGLILEVAGLLRSLETAVNAGRALALAGGLGYAYLLLGLFVQRLKS